jgi:hypothetical protein
MLRTPWKLWLKYDPVRSLADLLWNVFVLLTGFSLASITAWVSSTWNWYRQTLHLFGVAIAFGGASPLAPHRPGTRRIQVY